MILQSSFKTAAPDSFLRLSGAAVPDPAGWESVQYFFVDAPGCGSR